MPSPAHRAGTSFREVRASLQRSAALNAAAHALSCARSSAHLDAAAERGEGSAGAADPYKRQLREAEAKLPHWREALTLRAAVVAAVLGAMFCIVG